MSDTPTPNAPAAEEKAPEFTGEFDEDRAKRAIANLRAEVSALKDNLSAVTKERDDFRTAAEKTGEDRDKALSEALKRAEKAERDLAIAKHGLPDDVVQEFADYLTGTPEEVDAKAARLKARLAPKEETPPADDEGANSGEETPPQEIPGRPKPALTPGHGGDTSEPFDPAAIAKAARAAR